MKHERLLKLIIKFSEIITENMCYLKVGLLLLVSFNELTSKRAGSYKIIISRISREFALFPPLCSLLNLIISNLLWSWIVTWIYFFQKSILVNRENRPKDLSTTVQYTGDELIAYSDTEAYYNTRSEVVKCLISPASCINTVIDNILMAILVWK